MRTWLTVWSAATFAVLWIGFVVVLADDGLEFESVDRWFDGRSLPVRAAIWVLFLPIVVGVEAWTSSSMAPRIVDLVIVLVWTGASAASLVRLIGD